MSESIQSEVSPLASVMEGLPANLTSRLRKLRDNLLTGLVERDVSVRLALIAALAGEHLLMIGPPGTAKSLVARRLHLAFDQATYFERLLTRFTVPEELFGPLSIKGLEEDRYERLTESYLPTASIAFLDEIFKANSAILNSLLTLLNEREFDNGAKREKTPLIAVIGASNELPDAKELDALFDRFLLRLHVGPVSKSAFPTLLGLRGEPSPAGVEALRLTPADIAAIQHAAQAVTVPDDVVALLGDLRDWCMAEGIEVSDRRWRKVVKLLQVAALTNGRETVSIWDCWLLQHCLWNEPEAREKIYAWYAERVGTSAAMDPARLTRIVVSWEGKLKQDQDSHSQARDEQGRPLFKDYNGKSTINSEGLIHAKRGKDLLYLSPPNASIRYGSRRDAWEKIYDRTNKRNGFVLLELNKLSVRDNGGRHLFHSWPDRDEYMANTSNWHMEQGNLPPLMEPTRHEDAYVDTCINEVKKLREQVREYKMSFLVYSKKFKDEIKDNIWIEPGIYELALQSLSKTQNAVNTLLARFDKLRQDFEMLPRDSASITNVREVPQGNTSKKSS